MPSALARDLLRWRAEDDLIRARLMADGSLFDGYHPEMQAVHEANADRLARVVAGTGWPSADRVGEEAAEAAWIIVQHAISRPAFQRAMLAILKAEASAGRLPKWQFACLDDRIACHEGRPQTYGTQFDWDDDGLMSPQPIVDPDQVDARRATVGLGCLADAVKKMRHDTVAAPPADLAARRSDQAEWAIRVGWRRV